MKKERAVKVLVAVLSTAWYAALTLFCFIVFEVALFQFADKFLNNDVALTVIFGLFLIAVTFSVGNHIKSKVNSDSDDVRGC